LRRPILVLGHQGQLATEIAKVAQDFSQDVVFSGRDTLDLISATDPVALLDQFSPAAVINAAAYSAVDAAEGDQTRAMRLNGEVPGLFAAGCAERSIPFVHISSDYVFSGKKGAPYLEGDAVGPINVYGLTKAAGDAAVARAGGAWTILRTAWLFSASGTNFAKTMLKLATARDEIAVVDDQIGTPTYAGDCARGTLLCVQASLASGQGLGLLHLAGPEHATWADLAEAVLEGAKVRGLASAKVRRITSAEYPTASTRPRDTRLATTRTEDALGWRPPSWRAGVDLTLDQLET
jgi:dTDP-4-dehydrorhamnose reductase